MTRRPPTILGASPGSDEVELTWEVDTFFESSEAPEKVLITLNGGLFSSLDGDETSVSIPNATITALGATVITVGVVFWWAGPPVEEQHSAFVFTIAGPIIGGVYPAATPSLTLVRVTPRTTSGPASITIAWRSNNYNDGNIIWGPAGSPPPYRRSIKPRGERYSGEFTTDQPLVAGTPYTFRVEVRNTHHSQGWIASTITVTSAAATLSVRTYLIASGKPVTSSLASLVGAGRSIRAWLRG